LLAMMRRCILAKWDRTCHELVFLASFGSGPKHKAFPLDLRPRRPRAFPQARRVLPDGVGADARPGQVRPVQPGDPTMLDGWGWEHSKFDQVA
jgi:hypothetical protein